MDRDYSIIPSCVNEIVSNFFLFFSVIIIVILFYHNEINVKCNGEKNVSSFKDEG